MMKHQTNALRRRLSQTRLSSAASAANPSSKNEIMDKDNSQRSIDVSSTLSSSTTVIIDMEKESLKQEVEQLKETLKVTTIELSKVSDQTVEVQNLKNEIHDLKHQLTNYQEENDELLEDMLEASNTSDELHKQLLEKDIIITKLNNKCQTLEKERDDMADELCSIHDSSHALLKEKSKHLELKRRSEIQKYKQENIELQERYDVLQKERDVLEEEQQRNKNLLRLLLEQQEKLKQQQVQTPSSPSASPLRQNQLRRRQSFTSLIDTVRTAGAGSSAKVTVNDINKNNSFTTSRTIDDGNRDNNNSNDDDDNDENQDDEDSILIKKAAASFSFSTKNSNSDDIIQHPITSTSTDSTTYQKPPRISRRKRFSLTETCDKVFKDVLDVVGTTTNKSLFATDEDDDDDDDTDDMNRKSSSVNGIDNKHNFTMKKQMPSYQVIRNSTWHGLPSNCSSSANMPSKKPITKSSNSSNRNCITSTTLTDFIGDSPSRPRTSYSSSQQQQEDDDEGSVATLLYPSLSYLTNK